MHHPSLGVLFLAATGSFTTLFADSAELFSAEWAERRLAKDPQDQGARAGIVESRLKDNDLDRAEKALAEWESKTAKPSPDLDRLRGDVAFARKKVPEAIATWQRYLTLEPKDWETRMKVVQACAQHGDLKSAAQEVSTIIKSNPSAEAYAQRASLRVRLHDWAAAEADIRKADELDATNRAAQSLLPIFERSREWLPTVKKLDETIAKNPADVSAILNRAEWLIGIGLHDAGLDDIRAALKRDPKSLRAIVWNGVMAWEGGNLEGVGEVLELRFINVKADLRQALRSIDSNTDPESRARILLACNQPLLALGQVGKSEGSPARAQALYQLDRLPAAGAAARQAVQSHPGNAEAWLTLARVELQSGNLKEVIEAADRSKKIKRSKEADELRDSASRRLGQK